MRHHWPEYLTEALGLGLFMISAAAFGALLFHPASPAAQALPAELPRRALMGMAMAATAIALVHNRWGKQSGAHFNPALTLAFACLGKVAPRDAAAYITAQFVGGSAGLALAEVGWGSWLNDPAVNHIATLPGRWGPAVAWLAEFVIAFLLMTVVLTASASSRFRRFTGVLAGVCVFLFITFEAPLSGMSLNPARTLGSALAVGDLASLWIYFTAPPLGMLAASARFVWRRSPSAVPCAKLHHQNPTRCIFCAYQTARETRRPVRIRADTPLTRA